MNRGSFRYLAILLTFALLTGVARADDEIEKKYKEALARNNTEEAVALICDAAKVDPKKYGKKCEGAQKAEAKQLQQYDGDFASGSAAFGRKEYGVAIRELSKIAFGPHREEAHRIVQNATDQLGHPAVVEESRRQLDAAQSAYDSGDLTTALTRCAAVKAVELQPRAQQIVTNIHIYKQTMEEGDAALQASKFAIAVQKFKFAMTIKANGPGTPAAKLQKATAQLAAAEKNPAPVPVAPTAPPPTTTVQTGQKPAPPTATEIAQKVQAELLKARNAEEQKDYDEALAGYDRVLAIDPRQVEAVLGKQRIGEALKQDPKALEDTLRGGIRSYYQSHLKQASEAISLYLRSGGKRSKGAAYFYLGATMVAESLLLGPDAKTDQAILQKSATQQFQLAKQEHFQPVEKYVSPKILAIWRQSTAG